MTRAPFALLVFVVASAFAKSTASEVIFISPCECQGFHGKNRWIAKTDLTPVPLDKSAIQSVTPSQIYAWEGLAPDVDIMGMGEARMPSEEKWYALTGRVVDAKVEADGDIHLALEDATGNNVGTVSAEIPMSARPYVPAAGIGGMGCYPLPPGGKRSLFTFIFCCRTATLQPKNWTSSHNREHHRKSAALFSLKGFLAAR